MLCVSLVLAVLTAFAVPPDWAYLSYPDYRTLALLFCLMLIVAGFRSLGVFQRLGGWLLRRAGGFRGLSFALTLLCFFSSMVITNDVTLITFVPFTLLVTRGVSRKGSVLSLVVFETIAANLGSMATPIGNPQNLYLYSVADMGFAQFAWAVLPYTGISLVLLDIVMPVVDGFEVLDVMVHNHWIEDIPVIMISSEDSEPYIRRAYELGVSDYINRPFDAKIVCQRVYNTIKLYAKQRKLVTLVTDQIYEKEKNNQMMISILSQIVEFRNGESGLHVLHINILSELLLERLVQKTDKYQISAQRRSLITTASALHDIGKIGIDDKILNKPGRLTPEEFDEMKKHTIIGESILKNVGIYQNEELVQLAMHICRWHHERYDGRGYPDGLKGEEIPIEVQVVSIADVYDALVSERVYKKAYSHKKAVEMILNGECGQFNPLLLECLQDIQDRIDEEFQNVENQSEEENQERKVHDQIMETTVLG